MNKKVYYNQADSRWANHKYPSQELPNATIKSGGCGATSSAMIISSLTDKTIYPNEIGDIFVQKGIRVNGGTDTIKASKYISETYNLEYKRLKNNDDNDLINHIANGYVAMVNVLGGSVFSTGGHIIFICGYSNGLIQVYDPYLYNNKFNQYGRNGKVQVQGNSVWITNENWIKYAKSNIIHVFKIPVDSNIPKYSIGQRLLVDIPIKLAIDGEWCLVDSNNYQFWVFNSLLNNNKTKVYCLAEVDGYNEITKCYQMVVFKKSIYETRFDCKDIYLSDKY